MTPAGGGIAVRPAVAADGDAVWAILEPVYRAGETYCVPRDVGREAALSEWLDAPFSAFVALRDGQILGTSHVGPNRPAGGAHVANASFATATAARGKGVAATLVQHAKDWARREGYRAMQFNFVVASNADAIHVWQKAGFSIAGRLPQAFDHPQLGFVDALVMFHDLTKPTDTKD